MCSRSFGIGFVVVVVLAGFLYYLSTVTKAPPQASSIPAALAQQAQQRVNNAVNSPQPVAAVSPTADQTASAAATPATNTPAKTDATKGQIVKVSFDENDVNTIVQTNKDVHSAMKNHGIDAAMIHFFPPDTADITVWFRLHGEQRQLTATGTVTPDGGGGIAFHSDQSALGDLPLPHGMTADQIDHEGDRVLGMIMPNLPLSVTRVDVEGSDIVLTGPKR